MSTTVPPRDDGPRAPVSAGSALPNEEALRLAFFAQYSTLAAEARTALGDDAATLAPKVVEGAFVRAWDARDRLTTPAQLGDFLRDDVHHAAVRALSRRAAAHRLSDHESHGAPSDARAAAPPAEVVIDPDESWSHVLHAVRSDGHSQRALDETAAIARHDAAGHIIVATREAPAWKAIGIGVVGLAVVLAIGYWVEKAGDDVSAASAVNAPDARVVNAAPGQVGIVTLDDGSKVRLAPDSKLSIPTGFGPKLRAVKLLGAANFDVAKGQATEFRVYTDNALVVAKGTAFSVRAYPEDSATTIVVSEGSVEVREGKTVRPVEAGAALFLAKGAAPRIASPDEREEADAWRTGTLTITNRQLRDVLPQLTRWYNITVMVPDTTLLSRRVALRASLDSSRQAIRAVEQSAGVAFDYDGPTMVFRDASKSVTPKKTKK
ncbi:MAG TPA: FecR domain-containing protein [Gemmatimonadaceae bacterium]|nr:FecR domain-containing protein [Gemmatimonadaceae bacterium]